VSNLLHAGKQRLKDLRAAHTAVDRAYDKDDQGEIDAAFDRLDSLRNAIAADLDTLARIREAAGPDVRVLSDWMLTVPDTFDSEYAARARALAALLAAIDGTEP
jgi:hypothetical protein